MSQPIIDEIRKLGTVLDRIACALERATGIESPQAPAAPPARAVVATGVRRPPQGEPVRGPMPATRAVHETPPPKMGPRCNHQGPVYVGTVPIRCSEDAGHTDTPHSHAGYEWPNEAAQAAPAAPETTEPAGAT